MDNPADPFHATAMKSEGLDGLPMRRRVVAVAALTMGSIVATIGSGSVNIALPTIAAALHVPSSQAVFVVTIYQVVLLMTVLPLAALGDRIGHRTVFQWGEVVFIAGSAVCFFAKTLLALIMARALQAAGGAAILAVGMAMMRTIYPRAKLGRGMALNTLIIAGTAMLSPSLGGFILAVADWPWIFLIFVPLGLVSLAIGGRSLPDPERRDEPYDWRAAVMCAAMFGSATYGIEGAVHEAPWPRTAALLVAAGVIGTLFVRRELRQANPVLPVDLLRSRRIALLSAGTFIAQSASMVVLLSLPFRLQTEYGYSPAETGLVLASWTMMMTLVAPISGILSDRFSAGVLGSLGMAIAAAGLATLAFLPAEPRHIDLFWRAMLAATGFGIFYPPNSRQVLLSVPIQRAAAAGGLNQTARMTGQVLGSSGTAAMLAAGAGLGSLPALIAAGLAGLGGLCSIALLSTERVRKAYGAAE